MLARRPWSPLARRAVRPPASEFVQCWVHDLPRAASFASRRQKSERAHGRRARVHFIRAHGNEVRANSTRATPTRFTRSFRRNARDVRRDAGRCRRGRRATARECVPLGQRNDSRGGGRRPRPARVVGARIRRARVATRHPPRAFRPRAPPATRALDAAQPFDFEAKQRTKVEKKRKLKIGIVGFGNFGQFLAKRFIKNGHDVIATSRSDYDAIAAELGVDTTATDDSCEMYPDVVIFCTSILPPRPPSTPSPCNDSDATPSSLTFSASSSSPSSSSSNVCPQTSTSSASTPCSAPTRARDRGRVSPCL